MTATWWPGSASPSAPALEAGLGAVRDDDVRLRLAEAVVDREPPCLLERLAITLGSSHSPVETRRRSCGGRNRRELAQLGERRVLGGRLAEHGDAEPVDEVEALERVERARRA